MGIETYPEEFNELFARKHELLITREMLYSWQEKLDLFGEFFDDVLCGYDDLLAKPSELAWTAAVCRYPAKSNVKAVFGRRVCTCI